MAKRAAAKQFHTRVEFFSARSGLNCFC